MGTKNMRVLLAIVAIAASLTGCSQEGDLVVKNDATTEFEGYVEDQFVMIAPGEQYSTTIYIGKNFTLVGPTDIGIPISGSAWTKKSFSITMWVASGEQNTFTIDDDIGALDFKNNYSLSINEISVKMCDGTSFGSNLLEIGHKLAPGDEKLIQLSPGCWDVLVNYGREENLDTVTAITIDIGQVVEFPWDPDYVLSLGPPAAIKR